MRAIEAGAVYRRRCAAVSARAAAIRSAWNLATTYHPKGRDRTEESSSGGGAQFAEERAMLLETLVE